MEEIAQNSSESRKRPREDDAHKSEERRGNSRFDGRHKSGFKDRGRGRGHGRDRGGGRVHSYGQGHDRERSHKANEGGRRNKKGDMGRAEWSRNEVDKRKRNADEQEKKRQRIENGLEVDAPFTKEEIDGEARRPKKKVAVLIGYAGSGYRGMQINGADKTIERDLFQAFVAASAISKANADDPKKSSLVRCARTDKGVHAAGNVISLKLIVENKEVVEKINTHLPPQIRVWGIQRTNQSFSCYQRCDSRWYEYLIPTYCFLPPHPKSYLGKKLIEDAEKEHGLDDYTQRQQEVASFWQEATAQYIEPILAKLEPELRTNALAIIHSSEDEGGVSKTASKKAAKQREVIIDRAGDKTEVSEDAMPGSETTGTELPKAHSDFPVAAETALYDSPSVDNHVVCASMDEEEVPEQVQAPVKAPPTPLEAAVKEIKAAYITSKKAYRISEARRLRLQATVSEYLGTCNFHNYTIQKAFKDASAKRHVRSFKVAEKPITIGDTEWLSLKIHGQSFMMHQIRKMVAMAALIVRCGSFKDLIKKSYGPDKISIPKAPGLGLLLERPVFDSYNDQAVKDFGWEKIDFDKYQKEMDEFKQREIYDRIYREEQMEHQFHAFFHHLDHYHADSFLWITASGISAATSEKAKLALDDASDDEQADINGEEG